MKLHVDLNERALVSSPRARVPVRKLSVRRGDVLTVDVTFSLDGLTGPLPAGTSVSIAAYAGVGSRVPLVIADTPTVIGRGAATIYRFSSVSFDLSILSSYFSSQPSVSLTFEVTVAVGYASLTTSPVVLIVTQAADLGSAVPPILQSVPNTPLYIREITALVGGGATALDGVPTVGRAGLVVMCYVSNEMQTWRIFTGTDAENPSAGVVRPDDYHASSNPQVWKRVL